MDRQLHLEGCCARPLWDQEPRPHFRVVTVFWNRRRWATLSRERLTWRSRLSPKRRPRKMWRSRRSSCRHGSTWPRPIRPPHQPPPVRTGTVPARKNRQTRLPARQSPFLYRLAIFSPLPSRQRPPPRQQPLAISCLVRNFTSASRY